MGIPEEPEVRDQAQKSTEIQASEQASKSSMTGQPEAVGSHGGRSASAPAAGPSLCDSVTPIGSSKISFSLTDEAPVSPPTADVSPCPAPVADMSSSPAASTDKLSGLVRLPSMLVPPIGTSRYPWDGTWLEAKEAKSKYPAKGGHPWTVAADLFILEEVPKVHAAKRGRKMVVETAIIEHWKRWHFGFLISSSGMKFRYKFLTEQMPKDS